MGYFDDNLKDGEHVLYRTGLHWAILLGPSMLLVFGGLSMPSKGFPALIIFSIGIVWAVLSSISIQISWICVTDQRLLLRVGFPLKRICEIHLEKIQILDIYQPSLGKFLNFGKILIQSADNRRYAFRMVRSPLELKIEMEKQIASIRSQPCTL